MKNTIKTVRDSIASTLKGKTVEEMEDEARQAAVKSAVDDYLIRYPDWKPSTQPGKAGLTSSTLTAVHAAASAKPVTNTKQKNARIKKALGAGAGTFTPHIVDEEALRRAREAARAFQAADPERYSHIIESAPLRA